MKTFEVVGSSVAVKKTAQGIRDHGGLVIYGSNGTVTVKVSNKHAPTMTDGYSQFGARLVPVARPRRHHAVPYVCNVCGMRTPDVQTLTVHIDTVHRAGVVAYIAKTASYGGTLDVRATIRGLLRGLADLREHVDTLEKFFEVTP